MSSLWLSFSLRYSTTFAGATFASISYRVEFAHFGDPEISSCLIPYAWLMNCSKGIISKYPSDFTIEWATIPSVLRFDCLDRKNVPFEGFAGGGWCCGLGIALRGGEKAPQADEEQKCASTEFQQT